MNLPVVRHDRHLFSQIAMLDKTARLGAAFHTIALNKRYSLPEAFAKFVLFVRRDGNDSAP